MEADNLDGLQLSESQRLALQQFAAVTDQELKAAIPVLQRSEWNVQIAITRFFDGENANQGEGQASPDYAVPPRQITRRETLLRRSASSDRWPSARHLPPAPRIVPQSESQLNRQAHFILSPFLYFVNLLYRLITKPFGIFAYLFPFLPRILSSSPGMRSRFNAMRNPNERRPLNPRDTAARFIREFEEDYGSTQLAFLETGYAQALDLAKGELKFLLVILLSPEHDDTSDFIRHTLLSQEVGSYLRDPQSRILLWAGSVQDSEAYQVATALNCTKFPFAALITHTPQSSSTMSVVARIVGPTPPSAFVAKLQDAVGQYSEALDAARATQVSREAERSLRNQQNSAYERSLAQDRERARQKREAEAARLRTEQEAIEKLRKREQQSQKIIQWKKWRAQNISIEPAPDIKDSIRVSVRMPSGVRVLRRFPPDADMEELYAFVECYDVDSVVDASQGSVNQPEGYEHKYNFRLSSPMPRKVYEPEVGVRIGDRVGRNSNLIVEYLEDQEDEEG